MTSNNGKVGFVGLGNMGGPMATNLAKAGKEPVVYDLRPDSVRELESHGAVGATSLAELVRDCDVICTCVLYDHQAEEIFLGPNGIVTLGRAGQVASIHSTILPATVVKIAEAAAKKGIGIVDAPVSGGSVRSKSGELTLMIGGEDWAVERICPFFKIMGKELIRVGAAGAGQVVKLGNNIMALCNQVVHMEAIRFVRAHGVTQEALDRVASVSTGASWAASNYEHFDRYGVEHTLAGTPELPHRLGKDLRYAIAVAQEKWTYMPTVALCSQLLPGLFEERWADNLRKTAKS
jgi:3-hydroxyisobutyrate dehydrogenase